LRDANGNGVEVEGGDGCETEFGSGDGKDPRAAADIEQGGGKQTLAVRGGSAA
jgi:hypothetical protein